MTNIISFGVVKAIKCSLFGNTDIEAVLYLTALAILNEILIHYCTVRIFGKYSVPPQPPTPTTRTGLWRSLAQLSSACGACSVCVAFENALQKSRMGNL